MQFTKQHPVISAFVSAALVMPLTFALYFAFEPRVAIGQSEEFTITQEITQDIAFTAEPNDVPMDQTLSGLTGGVSNGTSTFAVATNNPDGYNVTIRFENAGSGNAMAYNDNPVDFFISNGPGTETFDLTQPAANEPALFAYTVSGDNTVQRFRSDGVTTCDDPGGTGTGENCFFMQGTITSDEPIINSGSPTSGTAGNVHFRVVVGQDPDPVLPTGFYTATATLTALTN